MPDERLKTAIRVQALLRQCAVMGLMATVARKGDAEAGALFLKINRLAAGCQVLSRISSSDGGQAWVRATGPKPVPEPDADAYLARQVSYDADLWVVEIEDPKAVFSLDERVVDI